MPPTGRIATFGSTARPRLDDGRRQHLGRKSLQGVGARCDRRERFGRRRDAGDAEQATLLRGANHRHVGMPAASPRSVRRLLRDRFHRRDIKHGASADHRVGRQMLRKIAMLSVGCGEFSGTSMMRKPAT